MDTTPTAIGRAYRTSVARAVALALAVGATAADFAYSWHAGYDYLTRGLLAAVALLALLLLARGDRATLGLVGRPLPGWGYWCKVLAVLAAVAVVMAGLAEGVVLATGWPVPPPYWTPDRFLEGFTHMVVLAPLMEETLYRAVLLPPVVALGGGRVGIVVGGVVFALLHVVYGNASPENQIGGFVLAWAYLRSGSLVVPVGLHALGNFAVLLLHLFGWFAQHYGLATI